jgi:hypothetical protein
MNVDARGILTKHTRVGLDKAVSYLPLDTVRNILRMEIKQYIVLLEKRVATTLLFSPQERCIKSGAIYAYSYGDLHSLLQAWSDLLSENGWPAEPAEFVKQIACTWLDERHPIMPV